MSNTSGGGSSTPQSADPGPDGAGPTIAFLVSAFNAEAYIRDAVSSALDQANANVSVWVLDDGSTDATASELSEIDDPRLHVIRRPNRGKAASMNELLELCGTEYFAMQDADDLSVSNRAQIAIDHLERDPELAMVLSGYEAFIDDRRRYRISRAIPPEEVARIITRFSVPSHDPTMVGRVDIARSVGFNPRFRIGQGIDFIWRVGEQHRVAVIPDVLYRYRVHEGSTTHRGSTDLTRSLAGVTAEAVARRTGRVMTVEEVIEQFEIRHDPANNMYGIYTLAVRSALTNGDRREAIRVGLHAARRVRLGPRYLRPLLLALVGERVDRWRRSLRRTRADQPLSGGEWQ